MLEAVLVGREMTFGEVPFGWAGIDARESGSMLWFVGAGCGLESMWSYWQTGIGIEIGLGQCL